MRNDSPPISRAILGYMSGMSARDRWEADLASAAVPGRENCARLLPCAGWRAGVAARLRAAADYTALEARVAELEQQIRHILPQKIDAIGFGISVMHGEMTEQFGDMRERLGRIELGQELQGEHLAEILRRLPGRPSNGPARGQDDH